MAWTAPKTWVDDDPLTAAELNEQLRDNLTALHEPPTDNYELDETSDYTTTSTTFVDVDSTNLSLSITTNGGDVLVHFHGAGNFPYSGSYLPAGFDIDVDGSRIGGDEGITAVGLGSAVAPVSFTRLISGLTAGSHTFKLQWRANPGGGSCKLFSGQGAGNGEEIHPQFWVREVT